MLEPEYLNPKEVLSHLNSLGFQDITPQQLKEFLHDLKKLIKYDQKHNFEISKLYSCSCSNCGDESDKSTFESCDSSLVSECSTGTYRQEGDSKSNGLSKLNSKSGLDNEKVQSSFIRPWHLSTYHSLTSKNKKSQDPVKLYHQYKESWNKVNIPGETKHSQLRWVIRNKMLGQEPQPRVVI